MRVTLLLILLSLAGALGLRAQDAKHIRLSADVQLDGQQFYRGEVFPLAETSPDGKLHAFLLMGLRFTVPADQATVLTSPPADFGSRRGDIVSYDKTNQVIKVDVGNGLSDPKDTCRVVTANGTVIPLIEKRAVSRPPKDLGERFRVCIPGVLPLVFVTQEVTGPGMAADTLKTPLAKAPDAANAPGGPSLVMIIGLCVAALGAGVAVLLLVRSKAETRDLKDRLQRAEEEIRRLQLAGKEEPGGRQGALVQAEPLRVADVKFAQAWVKAAQGLLQACDQVFSQAEALVKESQSTPAAGARLAALTHPSYEAIRTLPVSRWTQLLAEMAAQGATSDAEVVQAFSQLKTDEARKEELERLFQRHVATAYASQALILAEALCHLQQYHLEPAQASAARAQFTQLSDRLEAEGRKVGMREFRRVALRSPIAGQPQWLQLQGQEPSHPFGAPRGHVAQILRIGIVTTSEPNPPTIVLEGLD